MSVVAAASQSNEERCQDEDTARQQRLLDTVNRNINLAVGCIPEIEELLVSISNRTRWPVFTGLPAFITSLRQEHEALQLARTKLETPFSLSDLDAINKRVEQAAPVVHHGAVRWSILKNYKSLVAVSRTFHGSAREERHKQISQIPSVSGNEKHHLHRTLKEQSKVEVDVVDEGFQWIDVRWITKDRLARQMTDSGWSWGDYELGDKVDYDEWIDIPFVKQVKRLIAAARLNRHEYCIPRLTVVLPNLARGSVDIDVLLEQIQSIDPAVTLIIEDSTGGILNKTAPELSSAVANLTGNELDKLTPTINLDHTLLVDLISDLTHYRLTVQPWQEKTTRWQIDQENEYPDGLMLRTIHPVLGGRKLVCTREAAEHFLDMLTTVGTATERERGKLLVPLYEPESLLDHTTIRDRFKALSVRDIPDDIQLPVEILPSDMPWGHEAVEAAVQDGRLPAVARSVAARNDQLKSSKLSIYMYGWSSGLVTVTSNKEIKGQMKTWVEAGRTHDNEKGPAIWSLGVTRNLLAKSANPPPGWDSRVGNT